MLDKVSQPGLLCTNYAKEWLQSLQLISRRFLFIQTQISASKDITCKFNAV